MNPAVQQQALQPFYSVLSGIPSIQAKIASSAEWQKSVTGHRDRKHFSSWRQIQSPQLKIKLLHQLACHSTSSPLHDHDFVERLLQKQV